MKKETDFLADQIYTHRSKAFKILGDQQDEMNELANLKAEADHAWKSLKQKGKQIKVDNVVGGVGYALEKVGRYRNAMIQLIEKREKALTAKTQELLDKQKLLAESAVEERTKIQGELNNMAQQISQASSFGLPSSPKLDDAFFLFLPDSFDTNLYPDLEIERSGVFKNIETFGNGEYVIARQKAKGLEARNLDWLKDVGMGNEFLRELDLENQIKLYKKFGFDSSDLEKRLEQINEETRRRNQIFADLDKQYKKLTKPQRKGFMGLIAKGLLGLGVTTGVGGLLNIQGLAGFGKILKTIGSKIFI